MSDIKNDCDNSKQYTIQARLVSDTGEQTGDPLDLPIIVTVNQLELICNALLKNVNNFINFHMYLNEKMFLYDLFCRKNKHHIYFS